MSSGVVGIRGFDAIVIGGGATGLWSALDLTLRGFSVALLERKRIGSETSGRFHGVLHSGARYAVNDPEAASECINENQILYRIASHAIEDTKGYFIALTRDDEEYGEKLFPALRRVGIPYREIPLDEAFREEPELSRDARRIIEVPDKVIYARDLLVSIALTAFNRGSLILENISAEKIYGDRGILTVEAIDTISGKTVKLSARVVINAAGPWAYRVARAAGINVELMPTAGLMVVYSRRLTRRVINRMRPPSDGDILVPYIDTSIMGTTATIVEDPDSIPVENSDIEFLTKEGSAMIPRLRSTPIARVYSSVRPLIKIEGGEKAGRIATRGFQVVVHDKPEGLISVVGGKFTTARLMAERIGDIASEILGVAVRSRTRDTMLDGGNPYEALENIVGRDVVSSGALSSLRGGIDEERGRIAAYIMIQEAISRISRERLGI